MGMGFAPTWLRQVSPPASQNHFNHWRYQPADAPEKAAIIKCNLRFRLNIFLDMYYSKIRKGCFWNVLYKAHTKYER